MRKWLVFLLVIWMLLSPAIVRAQSAVTLESLLVQLWPDHDQLSVLVIYDFTLDPSTTLPVAVQFKLPANATLSAAAQSVNGDFMNIEKQMSGDVVSFVVEEKTIYHLEYYMPYQRSNLARDFSFTWPGDYEVKSFQLRLQQPIAATELTITPALTAAAPDKDGFTFFSSEIFKLAAGKSYTTQIHYVNETDMLNISSQTVKPSAPLSEPVAGQISMMSYLPWVSGIVLIVFVVGLASWYIYSSRENAKRRQMQSSSEQRAKRKAKSSANEQQQPVYCHQCGKRAQSDDRFCRTCGAQLRVID